MRDRCGECVRRPGQASPRRRVLAGGVVKPEEGILSSQAHASEHEPADRCSEYSPWAGRSGRQVWWRVGAVSVMILDPLTSRFPVCDRVGQNVLKKTV